MDTEFPKEIKFSHSKEFKDSLNMCGYYYSPITQKSYSAHSLLAPEKTFELMPGDKLILVAELGPSVEGSRLWWKKMQEQEWERVREKQKITSKGSCSL